MDDTDSYDANMDPAFKTSEDELDARPASVNSRTIPDQFARPGSLVFGDLKPSIQIEIIHNLGEELDGAIEAACTKLKVTDEEKIDLILYNQLYNRSLETENMTMLKYRKRQRAALKKLDQGVATHLVQKDLSNIFETTCRQLSDKRANLGVEDVILAKASDILLSYEFLDRIDLPRSLAGTWYNGLKTRFNGHYDYPTPESEYWEWAEDLSKRQANLGKFDATRPAPTKEEPRYLLATKAFGTKSSVKAIATLADKGKENASASNTETPFWHTQGPPTNVTDSEARYQWNLTQSRLEMIQHEKAMFEAELRDRNRAENPHLCAYGKPEDPW